MENPENLKVKTPSEIFSWLRPYDYVISLLCRIDKFKEETKISHESSVVSY